jgi:hypothetical protein
MLDARLLALLLARPAALPGFVADRQKVVDHRSDKGKVNVRANSLQAFGLRLDEMLPALGEASAGGVVRIAEVQS